MSDRPKGIWGKRAVTFYDEHKEHVVIVATNSGQKFKGQLVGVDVYDIVIRQTSGLELLIGKGNITYVHRASA